MPSARRRVAVEIVRGTSDREKGPWFGGVFLYHRFGKGGRKDHYLQRGHWGR